MRRRDVLSLFVTCPLLAGALAFPCAARAAPRSKALVIRQAPPELSVRAAIRETDRQDGRWDAGPAGTVGLPGAGPSAMPFCVADLCAPRVDVPGYGTGMTTARWRDRSQDLFVSLLARSPLPGVSRIAEFLASTGLALDFRPPGWDGSGATRLTVSMRWRLDADNRIAARAP